jgi:predicted alpha/beta hydrolase family esterase
MLSINTKIQKAFKKKVKDKFNIVTSEYNASLFLESTTINGIVAHDKDDDVVLFSEAIKLSNAWKNSQLISTEGFGHSMHNETLYKTISAFIEK